MLGYKVWQNGLQSASGITKCVSDYSVWQGGLQSASGITKCGRVDYRVHQELQNVTGLESELVQCIRR